ncbi:MAG: hypothetical protein ACYC1M_17790 [Armatimonadota bacterium]
MPKFLLILLRLLAFPTKVYMVLAWLFRGRTKWIDQVLYPGMLYPLVLTSLCGSLYAEVSQVMSGLAPHNVLLYGVSTSPTVYGLLSLIMLVPTAIVLARGRTQFLLALFICSSTVSALSGRWYAVVAVVIAYTLLVGLLKRLMVNGDMMMNKLHFILAFVLTVHLVVAIAMPYTRSYIYFGMVCVMLLLSYWCIIPSNVSTSPKISMIHRARYIDDACPPFANDVATVDGWVQATPIEFWEHLCHHWEMSIVRSDETTDIDMLYLNPLNEGGIQVSCEARWSRLLKNDELDADDDEYEGDEYEDDEIWHSYIVGTGEVNTHCDGDKCKWQLDELKVKYAVSEVADELMAQMDSVLQHSIALLKQMPMEMVLNSKPIVLCYGERRPQIHTLWELQMFDGEILDMEKPTVNVTVYTLASGVEGVKALALKSEVVQLGS